MMNLEKAFNHACGHGWTYDYRAECWRGPDEAILAPAPGPCVERLDITFQPPEWGCIDVRLAAGAVSFDFRFTDTWDRLPELVLWMEEVSAGGTPRFWYDIEGSEIEFHLWPCAGGLHLIVAHNTRIGRHEEVNVVISKQSLIVSLYDALISYWESPALIDNWRHWAAYTEAENVEVDENGYELHPYPLRSPMLDRFCRDAAARPS